jgi:hypothetical protein
MVRFYWSINVVPVEIKSFWGGGACWARPERHFDINYIKIQVFSLRKTHGQCERDFVNSPVQNPVFLLESPFF